MHMRGRATGTSGAHRAVGRRTARSTRSTGSTRTSRASRRPRTARTKVGGHHSLLHVWRHHVHGRVARRRASVGRMAGRRHEVTGRGSCSRRKAHLLHSSPLRHTVGAGGVGTRRIGSGRVGASRTRTIGTRAVGAVQVETRRHRASSMRRALSMGRALTMRRRTLWETLWETLRARGSRMTLGTLRMSLRRTLMALRRTLMALMRTLECLMTLETLRTVGLRVSSWVCVVSLLQLGAGHL